MAKYQKGTFVVVPNKHVLRGMKAEYQSVYLWICRHADESGLCFPSRQTLADEAGCSIRMVDYAITEFVEIGLLSKKTRKEDGKNLTSLYQLMIMEASEGGSAQDALGVVHEMHEGSVENATVSKSNEVNPILTQGENSVSQEKEKESFEEYMSGLGYEPYELEQNDYIYQTYRHEDGSVLSSGKLKSFQTQYEQKSKKRVGIEAISRQIKPKTEEQQVIQIFSYNPGHVTWFKNKTQKAAIKELLEKMSIPQMAQLVEHAHALRETDRFVPEIDTPYDLLTKMVKLKSRVEKGNSNLGVV